MRERLAGFPNRLSEKVMQFEKWTPPDIEETEVKTREKFNFSAAFYYGRLMIPLFIASGIAVAGPGINPNFVNALPATLGLGMIGGVGCSLLFGFENRRPL